MTLATRDVQVVEELPAGTQIIGLTGIDSAANEISISQTSTENKVQISNTPGENNVVVSGTVAVSNLTGSSTNEENVETAAIVVKNEAGVQLAPTSTGSALSKRMNENIGDFTPTKLPYGKFNSLSGILFPIITSAANFIRFIPLTLET